MFVHIYGKKVWKGCYFMNSNLPIPIETSAVPYMRPHTEKKRTSRSVILLTVIFALVTAVICACIFMPEEWKAQLGGWFSSETSDMGQTSDETTTVPETTEGTTAPIVRENIYEWKHELPQGATAIKPYDRSANALGIFAENPTEAVLEQIAPVFPKAADGISVIIVNTHSFETYAEDGAWHYTDSSFASNGDEASRIAAVAEALCEKLDQNGIGAVFVDCMAASAFGSYKNAKMMTELALEEHPEAVLVIDLHRAVLTDEKGALMRPITEIAGDICAQACIRLGVGAGYEENAAVALSFYEHMNLTYPELMMPLSVSEGSFLQELAIPVLTLEIGSAGNSVKEAIDTANLLAGVMAAKMKS